MTPVIDLTGRIAAVTGAARGIGLATARLLLASGATVIVNARRQDADTDAAFAELAAAAPDRVRVVLGSAADSETGKELARTAFQSFKRLDILVNNAGILRDGLIGMIGDDEIDQVLNDNVASALRMTQAVARLMGRNRSGAIINLSSIVGRHGNAGQFVYAASKAALIGATLAAAKELAPQGIRVNAVAPGLIDTRMTEGLPASARAALEAGIGLGRVGTADEVASVILFLASDLARYVTGQVIGVDGGLVL